MTACTFSPSPWNHPLAALLVMKQGLRGYTNMAHSYWSVNYMISRRRLKGLCRDVLDEGVLVIASESINRYVYL